MTEVNARICKNCKQIKERISAGSFNKKDKKWVDDTGKLWNGSVCPSCHSEKMKSKMKEKRGNNGNET